MREENWHGVPARQAGQPAPQVFERHTPLTSGRWPLAFAALALSVATSVPAAPKIERFEPRTLLLDSPPTITLRGGDLDPITEVWTSRTGRQPLPAASRSKDGRTFTLPSAVANEIGAVAIRMISPDGISDPFLAYVDEIPTTDIKASHSPDDAPRLELPSAVEGHVRDDVFDYLKISATAGVPVLIEVVASRIGSELDPVLRVLSADDRELAYVNDSPGLGPDGRIEFEPPADGIYTLELRDTEYRGGRNSFYRLRVALVANRSVENSQAGFEGEPNDDRNSASSAVLGTPIRGGFQTVDDSDWFHFQAKAGEEWQFTALGRSLGGNCDPMIELHDRDGSKPTTGNINESDTTLVWKAADDGEYFLRVFDLAGQHGEAATYRIESVLNPARFRISSEADFQSVTAGETTEFKLAIDRHGYNGRIELALEPPVVSIEIENPVIDQKAKEWTLKLRARRNARAEVASFQIRARRKDARDDAETVIAATTPAWKARFKNILFPSFDPEHQFWLTIRSDTADDADTKIDPARLKPQPR